METIRIQVIKYLEENGGWVFGGKIERDLGIEHKPSLIGRECRRMVEAELIEKQKVQINGEGAWVVQYRIKKEVFWGKSLGELATKAINDRNLNKNKKLDQTQLFPTENSW